MSILPSEDCILVGPQINEIPPADLPTGESEKFREINDFSVNQQILYVKWILVDFRRSKYAIWTISD